MAGFMSSHLRIASILALIAAAPTVAWARGATESAPLDLAARGSQLDPGEWVWAPEIAPSGPVTVYIDIESQLATVYRNGVRIGVTTISTGRPSYPTPTGSYTILQKKVEHYSNLYENAPMPYMQRLGWDGLALHAGELPGYPASHGCIRLPREFAIKLYRLTEMGGTVVIGRDPGAVVSALATGQPTAAYAAPVSHAQQEDELEHEWNPDASPYGPVTIVLSLSSKAAVVLRNGIEIGRSEVSFTQDIFFSSHVLTYALSNGRLDWSFVGAPGNEEEAGRVLNIPTAESIRVPLAFRHALDVVLEPGATLLITEDALDPPSRIPLYTQDDAADGTTG